MKLINNLGEGVIKFTSPLTLIEECGRICYQSHKGEITDKTAERFVKTRAMTTGHHSILEHSLMTVIFNNISRGFTHEQVRHRLSAISQESTRYVDESDFIIVPPRDHDVDDKIIKLFDAPESEDGSPVMVSIKEWYKMNECAYRSLRENKLKPEDARQVLPIGIKSQIAVSANYRQWRHIFSMRCDKSAHWEIRSVMCSLLNEVKIIIPIIFDDMVKHGECRHGIPFYVKTGEYKEAGMKVLIPNT